MLKLNDELINNYKVLVYGIIKNYSNESNKEDLFQAGMVGIMEASKKYDIASGVKFTTFAYKYILGEVLKYLREDRNMKIGRDLISDYKRIIIAKDYIYKNKGRKVSTSELSKILNMSESRINSAILYNEREISLNNIINTDDNRELTLEDTIKIDETINKDDKILLKDALNELDQNEKNIIYKRYFEDKTQQEIASEENLTQVKVYRYEKKVLQKLRDKMS